MYKQFNTNGKLLITGEYFVIDGAKALALPTRFGQSLRICASENEGNFIWKSFDEQKNIWFECIFATENFLIKNTNDPATAQTLQKLLRTAQNLGTGKNIVFENTTWETHLDFPRDWGLGSSSTLVAMLAQVFEVNAYALLAATFGGSGYDLACAVAQTPILYQRIKEKNILSPKIELVNWKPKFYENIFLVYLGKKQNSREGIARYKAAKYPPQYLSEISDLTHQFLHVSDLNIFNDLIIKHENIVKSVINLPSAKDLFFADFWGEVKSLGAWGGDFVLITSEKSLLETKNYFHQKGFNTILTFEEMFLG